MHCRTIFAAVAIPVEAHATNALKSELCYRLKRFNVSIRSLIVNVFSQPASPMKKI